MMKMYSLNNFARMPKLKLHLQTQEPIKLIDDRFQQDCVHKASVRAAYEDLLDMNSKNLEEIYHDKKFLIPWANAFCALPGWERKLLKLDPERENLLKT